MHSSDKDYYMPKCRWPLKSYTYGGLCSHFSINEGYKYDPPEELFTRDEINKAALESKQAKSDLYKPAKAANTKAYGDRVLEEQKFECKPCGLTFRSNAKKLLHQSTNIHKRKVAGIVTVPKGRPTKSFYCDTCKWKAPCSKRLAIHMAGPRHAKKLRNLEMGARDS